MSAAGLKAKMLFICAEVQYVMHNRELGCAAYLQGLETMQQESADMQPLEYLELCVQENQILIAHVLPSAPPNAQSSTDCSN